LRELFKRFGELFKRFGELFKRFGEVSKGLENSLNDLPRSGNDGALSPGGNKRDKKPEKNYKCQDMELNRKECSQTAPNTAKLDP
jgi:hypothetical protein